MTLPQHDDSHETFRAARDHLLLHRSDPEAALNGYSPPALEYFNWALDWFDVVAAAPETGARTAIWVVDEDGTHTQATYAELSARSDQLAAWLQAEGVDRGDRLLLMLANQIELWETMLACIKLGVVVIPATTLLSAADVRDRISRGNVAHVVARSEDAATFADVPGSWTRSAVG
jgi:acetyl-CoA synthetase